MGNGGWKSRVERRLWGGGRRENGAEAELCPSAPKFGILVEIIIIIIRGKKKNQTALYLFFFLRLFPFISELSRRFVDPTSRRQRRAEPVNREREEGKERLETGGNQSRCEKPAAGWGWLTASSFCLFISLQGLLESIAFLRRCVFSRCQNRASFITVFGVLFLFFFLNRENGRGK